MSRLGILIIIFLAFSIAICGCINYPSHERSPGGPAISPSDTVIQPTYSVIYPERGSPSIFIIFPPFDGGILAGNVTILVEVTNFTLTPPGGKNRPGTGHLIYYRDVVPPVMNGIPAFTPQGTFGVTSETTFEWNGIIPGTHTFAVELVNADNTPIDPPRVDAIDVTVVAPDMIINS